MSGLSWTGFCMSWKAAASGGIYPRICRHAVPATITFSFGRGMARWSASIISCTSAREHEGREASPSAAVVDSQSVRSASKGACADPVGYDAGKKVKGVKYQILVDTLGLMLNIVVHPADIQDRDGAALDKRTRQTFPFIEIVYADGGYQGDKAANAVAGTWQLAIVKRSDRAKGFVVIPKRVERTLSWLSRCRRLVRNHELYHRTAVAFIRLAMIRLMLRRVCAQ
jgi:transposase